MKKPYKRPTPLPWPGQREMQEYLTPKQGCTISLLVAALGCALVF